MTRRLSFVLVAALVAALAPLPALAQFNCPMGDLITLTLLPRPFGGIDYCVPDTVYPPLLCTHEGAVVRWKVSSTCQGVYTVRIHGSATKANITAPLHCDPEHTYQGPVQDDDTSFVCQPGLAGKYGYLVAVCRPDGRCASTDPGIWVNRGRGLAERIGPAEHPGTQAEYDAAQKEAKKIDYGKEADLRKLLPPKP